MGAVKHLPGRILRCAVLAALAGALAGGPGGGRGEDEPIHLVVLHTNDVHGQLLPLPGEDGPRGGLLRLGEEVRVLRERLSAEGAAVLVLDAGDWTQGTPEGRALGSVPFVAVLSAIGYDAMCLGNHELDPGREALETLLEHAGPPAVLANVREPTGERVGWAPPWRIVERAGLRIAVVGLLSTSTPRATHHDARALEFRDPRVELAGLRAELAGEDVDLILPLTHLGLEEDERLARASAAPGSQLPPLPLIVGGHSHTFLSRGKSVGGTLIAQAGQKSQALGRVDLWIERESGRVTRARAQLIELPAGEEELASAERGSPALAALCRELVREAGSDWTRIVGRLAAPLERTRESKSSSAGNLVADVLRAHAAADVGLHNKGGLRRDLPAGEVRARDVYELVPFDNTLVVLELDGADLEALLRYAVDGRRGLSIELSGATLELVLEDGRLRITELRVGGEPLQSERTYRLATNSFLAHGGDEVVPPELRGRASDTGVLVREALEQAFAERGVLTPSTESRVLVQRKR